MRESSYLVEVLNLNQVNEEAFELIKASDPRTGSVEKAVPDGPWGLLRYHGVICCVRFDGTCFVLTAQSPLTILYYVVFDNGTMLPEDILEFTLMPDEVLKLPIARTQSLDTFIIEFGEVPDDFYSKIISFLDSREEPLLYYSKKDLKKMQKFLKKDWCECEKHGKIIAARQYSCPCERKRKHTHCNVCGGIIKMIT